MNETPEPRREASREGSLEAPTRHPIEWRTPEYYDAAALNTELERVFDICHGCRRCVNLCQAFPTLFDLVDNSPTMEVDGVAKEDYGKVVDQCYLCDMCYMSKCPYVPPHPWNVDFPHLMLRAKAVKHKAHGASLRDRLLTSTDLTGKLAGIPVVTESINSVNRLRPARKVMEKVLGIHAEARLPEFAAKPLSRRLKHHTPGERAQPAGRTRGKVALYATCYGQYNSPELGEDLLAIFEHNGIPVTLVQDTRCCGMPKLELGDFDSVDRLKQRNLPLLDSYVQQGYDIVAPVPSCVLMYKQELRLMYPQDEVVQRVSKAMFDPFEYLMLRHREGKLRRDFPQPLGSVSWQVSCHLRVQNIGHKTKEVLELVPGTQVQVIERCAGHDGTYGVRKETQPLAMKIGRPVFRQVQEQAADHYSSDCPIACKHIENGTGLEKASKHPLALLRHAYGI